MDRIVFDSPSIRARHVPGRQGLQVVTFGNRTMDAAPNHTGFGERFLKRHGLSAIHVTTSDNHYWQTGDLWPAMHAIRAFAGVERIVAYGSSMGAYGALLCSAALGADAVLALSPIFSVNPAKLPFDHRRRVAGRRYPNDDLAGLISRSARIFVLFDPFGADRHHARMIHGLQAQTVLVPLPFAGHPCSFFLRDIGALSGLVLRLLEQGDYDARGWRAEVRARRGRSPAYWRAMSQAALRRKRIALATEAARRALAASRAETELAKSSISLGSALDRGGRHAEAVETLLAVIAHHPRIASAHAALANAYLETGNCDAALRHADMAIDLDSGNGAYRKLRTAIRRKRTFRRFLPFATTRIRYPR